MRLSELLILLITQSSGNSFATRPVSYLIGGIIALLIMGYLIYTLLHPDKF